jgi:hypothetical protein
MAAWQIAPFLLGVLSILQGFQNGSAFAGFSSNASSVVPTACGGGFAIGIADAGGGTSGGFPLSDSGGAGGTGMGAGAAGVGGGTGGGFPPGGGACGVVVGGMRLVCIDGVGKLGVLVEGLVVISKDALAFPFRVLVGNMPGMAVADLVCPENELVCGV